MAISNAVQSPTRSPQFLLALGLCLTLLTGCSNRAADDPTADQSPSPFTVSHGAPSESASQDSRPELPRGVFLVSKLLVESSLNYDACSTCSDIGFLVSAELLTTRAELKRLERSQRAHLPWTAMQSRHERSHMQIIDIHGQPSKTDTWSVIVSGTRTIRTTSATSRSFVQVRLSVIPKGDGWKVAQARGAGL